MDNEECISDWVCDDEVCDHGLNEIGIGMKSDMASSMRVSVLSRSEMSPVKRIVRDTKAAAAAGGGGGMVEMVEIKDRPDSKLTPSLPDLILPTIAIYIPVM